MQDLVRAAERVFNHRETPKEREDHIKREKKNLELKKTIKIKKSWPRYFLLGLKQKQVPERKKIGLKN